MPDLLERLKSALADRYAIESEIGRGGMAVVFLAEDLKHHRQVAIKVLHPELTATLGAERFLHEIEIVAGLQHPHIQPLYDSGDADGLLYYVMPYARGESLRHRLDREQQLAVDESVRIAVEVADGLDYAHRQGVVHRDIKPGNILLAEGHATIADFGIARAVAVARAERVTSTGLGVGTPLYASPEQTAAQETLDGRTDIYSLGCVLYEMLAGEPPLTGSTPEMIQARRLSETPTALHSVRDTIPPALDQAISRALARVPADRYATASQFGQALQAAVLVMTPATSGPYQRVGTEGTVRLRSAHGVWRRLFPVVVTLAALLVTAALIWVFSRERESIHFIGSNHVQVTSAPGLEFQPAISPDGREVAYVVSNLDSARIVVRSTVDIGRGDESRPGGGEGVYDWTPSWTPDGALRFVGVRAEEWSWWEVGKYGGGIQRKLDHPPPGEAAWSRDGTRVAWVTGDSIYASPASRDDPQLLAVHPDVLIELHSLEWSWDGRWIAYVSGNPAYWHLGTAGSSSIWMIDSSGGDPIRVTADRYIDQSPEWHPDNRHLLFVSDREGAKGIYAVDSGSGGPRGEPRSVLASSEAHSISLSEDGKKLAYAKFPVEASIWAYPTPRSGSRPLNRSDRVEIDSENQLIEQISISADGDWLAFDSDRLGELDIYRMSVEGGRQYSVADIEEAAFAPEWSPDGTEVAFATADGVFVAPADGGTPLRVSNHYGPYRGVNNPAWSPEGLDVAFSSDGGMFGAPMSMWIASRDSVGLPWRDPVQLADFQCWRPDWDPAGDALVCDTGPEFVWLSPDGRILSRIATPDGLKTATMPRFSPDGARIYFYAWHEDGRWGLSWMPSAGGHVSTAILFDDPTVVPFGLTVGHDNLYVSLKGLRSDIWVMDLDW